VVVALKVAVPFSRWVPLPYADLGVGEVPGLEVLEAGPDGELPVERDDPAAARTQDQHLRGVAGDLAVGRVVEHRAGLDPAVEGQVVDVAVGVGGRVVGAAVGRVVSVEAGSSALVSVVSSAALVSVLSSTALVSVLSPVLSVTLESVAGRRRWWRSRRRAPPGRRRRRPRRPGPRRPAPPARRRPTEPASRNGVGDGTRTRWLPPCQESSRCGDAGGVAGATAR
jgi:hypothetical protein